MAHLGAPRNARLVNAPQPQRREEDVWNRQEAQVSRAVEVAEQSLRVELVSIHQARSSGPSDVLQGNYWGLEVIKWREKEIPGSGFVEESGFVIDPSHYFEAGGDNSSNFVGRSLPKHTQDLSRRQALRADDIFSQTNEHIMASLAGCLIERTPAFGQELELMSVYCGARSN